MTEGPIRGWARVGAAVLAYAVAGALLGVVGCFYVPTPGLGLMLGIAGLPALVVGAAHLSGRVRVGLAAYLAWLVVVLVFTLPRHFEAAVVEGTLAGDGFIYGGSGTGVLALAMTPLLTARRGLRPLAPPSD